jgi:hypothetical protein
MPGHISLHSSLIPTRELKILYSGMNHFHVCTTPAGTSQFLKFSHYGALVVLKKKNLMGAQSNRLNTLKTTYN